MKKKFASLVMAMRAVPLYRISQDVSVIGKLESSTCSIIIKADDVEEAKKLSFAVANTEYPKEDGWCEHRAVVAEVPLDWMEVE